jgi:hypothetical protein
LNHYAPHHAIEDAEDRAGFWLPPEPNPQYVEFEVKSEESSFSARVDKMPGDRRFVELHDVHGFGSECIQLDLSAVQFRALVEVLGRVVF